MTTIETNTPEAALSALISECFSGGEVLRRELRLTNEQAALFTRCYPAGRADPIGNGWYEITFQGVFRYGT